jgi:hypothetical protein
MVLSVAQAFVIIMVWALSFAWQMEVYGRRTQHPLSSIEIKNTCMHESPPIFSRVIGWLVLLVVAGVSVINTGTPVGLEPGEVNCTSGGAAPSPAYES